jgi:hypothetical protein
MYSTDEFTSLENMCRARATLAKKEMEAWFAEAEYWLAEAEEWKQLRESPFMERTANRPGGLAKSNNHLMSNDTRWKLEH